MGKEARTVMQKRTRYYSGSVVTGRCGIGRSRITSRLLDEQECRECVLFTHSRYLCFLNFPPLIYPTSMLVRELALPTTSSWDFGGADRASAPRTACDSDLMNETPRFSWDHTVPSGVGM